MAFLRAINVGGHVVKMTDLRKHFQAVGFTGVETFIASGNVVFETAAKPDRALEEQIEAQLKKRLGYAVETFVRSIPELRAIAGYAPFTSSEFDPARGRIHVGFLHDAPSAATTRKLNALRTETEGVRVRGRELYWIMTVPFADSALAKGTLDKALGTTTTLRNINTVRRLVAKYGGGD